MNVTQNSAMAYRQLANKCRSTPVPAMEGKRKHLHYRNLSAAGTAAYAGTAHTETPTSLGDCSPIDEAPFPKVAAPGCESQSTPGQQFS